MKKPALLLSQLSEAVVLNTASYMKAAVEDLQLFLVVHLRWVLNTSDETVKKLKVGGL